MRYGEFDDRNREYVITTPETPYPWINYLGTQDFFALISQQAGGYCFYRDARLRRVLRYRYNNVPTDLGGRYFYVREGDDFWCPSFMPVRRALERFECRHGLGYTRISGRRAEIEVETLFLVPLDQTAEIQQVKVRNLSRRRRQLKLFSFVEFCLWNAYDDMTNFQRNFSTGEVEVEGGVIYHKTEYRERRNHYACYGVNAEIAGFDTDRESFVGLYNGLHEAQAVVEGRSRNSVAHGWSPIGSHALDITLEAGEERSLIFVLGYVENPVTEKWERPGVVDKRRAKALLSSFARDAQVDDAMRALAAYWEELLSRSSVECGDARFARTVNIWNPYQCMVTFNMSRSASYFESGIGRGMGFRDSNQDLLGFVHLVPDRARQRLLDVAATQFADGSAYHQYQPLTKRGNNDVGSGFNDDPLWLIVAVAAYIKETGDDSILSEQVPFDNDLANQASMLEHLKRSFQHVLANLGPHSLPLIGRADWNDCLNLNCFSETPDEPYQTTENRAGRTAESVFIAALFVYAGPDYAALVERAGLREEACAARAAVAAMKRTVVEHGWDGDWFLRAYDYFGKKVGSHENEEGQIFIEPQGYCVMAGIGIEDGLAQRALDAVRERLNTPYGIVLNNPPFERYHIELGEISSYPPGYKENAGVFCHNNPWIVIAETLIGRGDRAFEYYKETTPAYLEDESEIHRTEPYVYSQMVAGKDAVRPGEAKNSWLTGTAAWYLVAASHYLLGVRPEFEGLRVRPARIAELGDFSVTRRCRGALYRIRVTGSKGRGPWKLTVDGRVIEGDLVPYAPAGATVDIVCA